MNSILDAQNDTVSERSLYRVLKQDGFARLPRRDSRTKTTMAPMALDAPKSVTLGFGPESFASTSLGMLTFLPSLHTLGLAQVIKTSSYPETTTISRFSSICAFLALTLTNVRRVSCGGSVVYGSGMRALCRIECVAKNRLVHVLFLSGDARHESLMLTERTSHLAGKASFGRHRQP